MAAISNTPRPGYVWDSTDNVWYPIGTGPHTHADYITSGSAINPTIVDAKGDIIAATAADTVARLAVGANDTVLTADSSTATGLKWATPSSGGMTLISTTTLSAASTTISFTPTGYVDLAIRMSDLDTATNANLRIRLNNDSGSVYYNLMGYKQGDAGTPGFDASFTGGDNIPRSDLTIGGAELSSFLLNIYNCNDTTNIMYNYSGLAENTSNDTFGLWGFGRYDASAAITSITVLNSASASMTGTVRIYGVK